MKKTLSTLVLCSLLLTIGIANAGDTEYSMTEYQALELATIDGQWTTVNEWTDGVMMLMSEDAVFTYNMDMTAFTIQWLVEIFTDNTDAAGDYWQICLDPDNSGGTAPQTGDFMIKILGHTTIEVYAGTGTGWGADIGSGELVWANSISDSPWNSNPHYILELSDPDKQVGTIVTGQPPNGMRVAVYDADTDTLEAWPPGSNADVPNEYGVIADYSQEPIPEVLSLVGIIALLSVGLLISSKFLQKPSKKQEKKKYHLYL